MAASSLDAPKTLPATLRLGAVDLTVTDLDRSIVFYTQAVGMRLHSREPGIARLGTGGDDVVILHESIDAEPAGRHAGMYHFALLFPTRAELAHAAARLAITRTPIQGASDHGTHEAIYLPDPDGNGIELAADRPRSEWPDWSDAYAGGPQPLDLNDLLAAAGDGHPNAVAEPGLRVGHMHLHVGDVDEGLRFYRDVVGFELIASLGNAAFVSADGYHHHLAFNVWRGAGVPSEPDGVIGLRHWTIALPAHGVDALRARAAAAGVAVEERDGTLVLRDPWGIELHAVTVPELRSHAAVATAKPSPYLLQLAKHFRHKLDVSFDDREAVIRFAFGRAELRTAGEDELSIEAIAATAEDLRRVEQVVGRHLERFGARDSLSVSWS
jgi:catechol 2,3-dioxygenase